MAALQKGSYAFQSKKNHKYLHNIDETNGEVLKQEDLKQEVLQFSGDDVESKNAKFQVEEDEEKPNLVHIKSYSNGKYLRRAGPKSSRIVAGAEAKDKQQELWSCTLFEPEEVHGNPTTIKQFRLRHVQLKHFIEPFSAYGFDSVPFVGRKIQPEDQDTDFDIEFYVEELTE